MSIKRNILISICLFACAGVNVALANSELKVKYKKGSPSLRINYATEQVRLACEAFSLKATLKVDIQDEGEEEVLLYSDNTLSDLNIAPLPDQIEKRNRYGL